MRRKRNSAGALALAALLSGCVSGSGGSAASAPLERNRSSTAPAWVELAPARWLKPAQGGSGARFVFARDRLSDVAGGLKETQLGAMDASLAAFLQSGRDAGAAVAGPSAWQAASGVADVERAIEEAAREAHGRLARIADAYYELGGEDTGGKAQYRAWVLVEMPAGAVGDLLDGLGRRLARSTDPKARRLADSLKKGRPKGIPELSR